MVRTRIAPSPTGFPHIGTIYQALFDYAFAKQHNGQFIVRIEDTDRARFVEGAEEVVFNALDWFGFVSDENPKKGGEYGPYRQSERLDIYKKYALELIEKKHAYYCFCTRERLDEMRKAQEAQKIPTMYDRFCRNLTAEEVESKLTENMPYVIRMKVPDNRTIVFNDLIIGNIEFESATIDDQVIFKSDGFPTYHLAVVVDDHLMKITHIFRGKEWIPSAPKHVLLYEYFGWEIPVHAHLPLILNDQGKGKLGKRFGHASVDYYRDLGFLPEAVINYLSNIVWNHPDDIEIYSVEELIKHLDITKVTSQGARFDLQKLLWMNGEYIRKMEPALLSKLLLDFHKEKYSHDLINKTIPLIQERIKTLKEYDEYCNFFVIAPTDYEVDLGKYSDVILKTNDVLSQLSAWSVESIGQAMLQVAVDAGLKNSEYFMVMRVIITGKKISPPLNESMELLGKEECLKRLHPVTVNVNG